MPSSKINISLDFKVYHILMDLVNIFTNSTEKLFNKVLLIGVQHLLRTTLEMFSVMKQLGLQDAIIGGKTYSTHAKSAQQLEFLGFEYVKAQPQNGLGNFDYCMHQMTSDIWVRALNKIKQNEHELIIILDDGGDLLASTPISILQTHKNIIGIEQTTNGIVNPIVNKLPFPVISVAGAYSKTLIEYPHVAKDIAEKTKHLINKINRVAESKPIIGIVGFGMMGNAIINELDDYLINVFEKNKPHTNAQSIHYCDTLSDLITTSDIIIGCTGENIFEDDYALNTLLNSNKNKYLISTGSKDKEFIGLLRHIQKHSTQKDCEPLNDIKYKNNNDKMIQIIRGGFPVNFTNKAHSVPPEHIWPTRASLLLSCLMGIKINSKKFDLSKLDKNLIMLDPLMQFNIIKMYMTLNANNPHATQLTNLSKEDFINQITKLSKGILIDLSGD